MENQRLTTFFIIAFVLLMHGILLWAIFYQPPVRIDTGMQSLNFVDLNQGTQATDIEPTAAEPKPKPPVTKPVSPPKPQPVKPQPKPVIKPVEPKKITESHFKVAKDPDTPKTPSTPTPTTAPMKSDPTPSQSVQHAQDKSANSDSNDQPRQGTTSHGSDLVVPKEYQGGFLAKLRPIYPTFSSENGEEGVVGISVSVAADGSPISVTVSESSGYSRLDRSAKQAVQNYRFKPATRGGIPIPYKYHFNVRFSLNK